MKGKAIIIMLVLLMHAGNMLSAEDDSIEENGRLEEYSLSSSTQDMSGLVMSMSCFNYFSVGLGYNFGEGGSDGHHPIGHNLGILIEYKTVKELVVRLYGHIYGGAGAMLLGVSPVFITDFRDFSFGFAPEIGIGLPGFGLIYRYNMYYERKFNCHQIGLILYPLIHKKH